MKQIYEIVDSLALAEKIYFAVIEQLGIDDTCIDDLGDHTENTDFGKDLYYCIEDIIRNKETQQ